MPSPLFNAFGNQQFGNMGNLMQRFNQFRRTFNGNPQEQVQQLLNSGQMSQEQFNQLRQMAEQFRAMIK